ncbi:thioesterase family protein [Chelatococcus albus]
MLDLSNAPALFFAPFVSSTMRVEPQWVDYNGHLNMAYYNVLFDRAVDEAFGLIGLGPDYTEQRRASFFLAESHVLYRRELQANAFVRVTVQLLDFDERGLHYYMELRHAAEGWLSATSENLALHVGMEERKVTPFPPDILSNLAFMRASHTRLPRPDALGRVIGLKRDKVAAKAAAPKTTPEETRLASGTRH